MASNLTLSATTPVLNFGGASNAATVNAITPGTTLTVASGKTLTLANDTIGANVNLVNQGYVVIPANTASAISAGLSNAVGATIEIQSSDVCCTAPITVP
ncbi:MAG: hypothetical protein IPP41_04260 [Rhodocyclaceae bacterium]|nr:hypothetical protein [Rhodocyclaceae bacterium]